MHLSNGPLDERAARLASSVDRLIVIVGVTQVLCLHVTTNVLTTGRGESCDNTHKSHDSHLIISVLKLMMDAMKLSLMMICLMALQSLEGSPRRAQMLSRAIFTILGGLFSALISTNCCFLMDFTARV